MMLEKADEFRYYKEKLKLPIAKGTLLTDNMIILFIKNTNQALDILNNPLIQRLNYLKYFKPEKYNAKLFNNTIKEKLTSSDINDMNVYVRSLKMNFVHKSSQVSNKNVVVDTSQFHDSFFEKSEGKNFQVISSKYMEMYIDFMNNACNLPHVNKCIFLNIEDWGISKDNITKNFISMHKLLNPISIIYSLMKKDITTLSPLGNVNMVILDGSNGWFTFNFANLDESSYRSFYRVFQKVKSEAVSIEDVDAESESDKENKIVVLDDEVKSRSGANIEDENVYDVDKANKADDDEEEKEDPRSEENDQEKLLQAAQEIEDNFETVKRSMPSNKRNEELREKQKQIKLNKLTLGDIQEGEGRNFQIDEIDLSDKIFAPTKNIKKVRFDNFNKSYVEKAMERDIMNVFLGLNDRSIPVYIRNVKKEDTSTPMDLKDTYHIELEGEDRVRHSITIDIPKVYDGNYFFLGGNRKQFNNQQFLKPVVKIAPDTVQICTNYNKIFMYRYGEILSPKVTIFKKIILNNPKYFKVKRGNATKLSNGRKTSIEYDSIAKDFTAIEIVGKDCKLEFDQRFYDDLIERKKIEPIGDDWTYCFYDGKPENKAAMAIPIDMEADNDGRDVESPDEENEFEKANRGVIDLFCFMFKKKTGLDFWELAGDKDKAGKRFMYTRCTIMAKKIPTIILLSYFEGLTTVMNKAGIKYQFSDKRTRTSVNQGIIQFADGYLIYERNPTGNSLLMNGLSVVSTKDYPFEEFNKKDVYLDIFAALFDSRILASGLDAYYDNMIDPITKDILIEMDYPIDFVSLVIFASNLLADNSYSSEIAMDMYRIRNMEMVSAFLYKIIANAYSNYRRTAMNKTPQKISVPKNALIKELLTSNILEDYSVINPIVEKKKLHALTCKGPSGVNLDRAYTEARRCYDPTMVGLVAMTTPPDANVGVQRELTAEPKIMNSRGLIDLKKDVNEMKDINIFSGPELLTPLSIQYDDCIRASMTQQQSKHLIPVQDMSPVLISNGYEKTLPYTVSKDFAIQAKDDGVVKELDEKTHMMILEYKDGSHEAVNLNPVIVKNGGGGFYLSNKLESNYRKGQKFKKLDIIAQNDNFFSNHYDGCKFNIGTLCKVACMSSFATFEDSKLITTKLSKRMATEMIMNKHIILGQYATVSYIAKKGQEVKVGDELIRYEQSNSEEAVNKLLSNIGSDLKEEIKNMGKTALKSKYNGIIEDIRIYSTFDLDELSPSLKKIVGDYWKEIKSKKSLVSKYKINDPTYMGSTFYEVDGPTKPDEKDRIKGYKVESGGVIFEFYIKYKDIVGVGDKIVDFAALKGVVAAVIPEGEEPYTIDHPDEEISTIFPKHKLGLM